MTAILYAVFGTLFLFLMTSLGAAMVFIFKKEVKPIYERICLGFAAGVMMAASVWSLINPAVAAAEELGIAGWIPAGGGVILGALFLLLSDIAILKLQNGKTEKTGKNKKKSTVLLQLAMTLHNIPEGMAVGLSFASAAVAAGGMYDGATASLSPDGSVFYAAVALALGIGIQNFPEGAAISLPLYQGGMKKSRAFLRGALSGIVEPIFGVLVVLWAGTATPLMPWLLSFAAGAMLYVVVEELIPTANEDKASFWGTLSILGGFLVMMILDIALG